MPDNNFSSVEERFLTDEDFLKIPGIYFDTASGILDTLGSDKEIATNGAKFIAKVGFGVGTAIDLTVNLSKDENSYDFYVVLNTIGKNIIKYMAQDKLSGFSPINLNSFCYKFSCVVLVLYLNSHSLR